MEITILLNCFDMKGPVTVLNWGWNITVHMFLIGFTHINIISTSLSNKDYILVCTPCRETQSLDTVAPGQCLHSNSCCTDKHDHLANDAYFWNVYVRAYSRRLLECKGVWRSSVSPLWLQMTHVMHL